MNWDQLRSEMVSTQIESRGIKDPGVLAAMKQVPRHLFVPASVQSLAYTDQPLPIGHDQTISQPYIVALMTSLAGVKKGDRVLEIGTGSGYQAAVLAQMGAKVYSIEIIAPLADEARARLHDLGYQCWIRAGDGWDGWSEEDPFSVILITASTPVVPPKLKAQLAPGGTMVLPEETNRGQVLVKYTKGTNADAGLRKSDIIPVRFVPLTGKVRNNSK